MQLAVARLRVRIHELNNTKEEAVKREEFLKVTISRYVSKIGLEIYSRSV